MMNIVTRDTHQKIYFQLYKIFKKKIEDEEWKINSKIPSEKELCKMYNISRTTVRAAIGELVKEGYLIRIPGKGTFVLKKSLGDGIIMLVPFKEIWLEESYPLSSKILVRTVIMPVENLHKILNISLGTHIVYIKKLWLIKDTPSILQEFYVPYFVCSHLLEEELENKSIIEFIENKAGIKITEVKVNFDMEDPSSTIKKDLKIHNNEKVLMICKTLYSGPTPVIYSKIYKKNDGYKLSFKMERKSL